MSPTPGRHPNPVGPSASVPDALAFTPMPTAGKSNRVRPMPGLGREQLARRSRFACLRPTSPSTPGLMVALSMCLAVVGCGGTSQSSSSQSAPPRKFGGNAAPHKFGAPPGTREYRVHTELILDLGRGTKGSVTGVQGDCVNADGGFAFDTGGDGEKHDLWIDASVSVIPPCWNNPSWQHFDVNVSSPYKGKLASLRLQQQGGMAGRPYQLLCPGEGEGIKRHLACKENGPLSVTVYCTPPMLHTEGSCAPGANAQRRRRE